MIRSLYVHFPFCESKCHYCDFYSLGRERTRPTDALTLEQALSAESRRVTSSLDWTLDTIFFGGGTPSMTPASSMARALEPLRLSERVTPQTEWTMEANPSSIRLESMREYRLLGINRISMGVQSMRDDLLTQLGRVHSRRAACQALEDVFSAGFENVSVDLLCGVPGQKLHDLEDALASLTAYPITHLSCYLLTLPKHHKMFNELPDDETQLEHLLLVDQWMRGKGFEHYEISNFAKPAYEARHNLNYWKGASYLGLGPSAHSFDSKKMRRWKNVSSLHKYGQILGAGESAIEWTEELTPDQRKMEKWMLALRLAEGFPEEWLDNPLRRARAAEFEKAGLIERHPVKTTHHRLTARGFALSDPLIAALV